MEEETEEDGGIEEGFSSMEAGSAEVVAVTPLASALPLLPLTPPPPPMAAAKLWRTKPEAAAAREEGRSSGDSGSGVYLWEKENVITRTMPVMITTLKHDNNDDTIDENNDDETGYNDGEKLSDDENKDDDDRHQ